MLRLVTSLLVVLFTNNSFAEHNGGGGDKGRDENTPSFTTLSRAYDNKNAERYLGFALTDGNCFASSDKKVAPVFKLSQFGADIDTSRRSTKFSDPSGKIREAYEDETFHDPLIGLHFRSATREGSTGSEYRNYTIPIWEKVSYQQPTYFGPIRTGTKTVTTDAERLYEVAISHETKQTTFNGKKVNILKATGTSNHFKWDNTVLYYCIFDAK